MASDGNRCAHFADLGTFDLADHDLRRMAIETQWRFELVVMAADEECTADPPALLRFAHDHGIRFSFSDFTMPNASAGIVSALSITTQISADRDRAWGSHNLSEAH